MVMTALPLQPALYWELRARHADVELCRARLMEARRALREVAQRIHTHPDLSLPLDITQGTYDLNDETRSIVPRWTPETAAGSGSAS